MIRSSEYTKLAHRKATIQHLQRILKEKHLDTDSAEREPLICEEVFYADRIVSQDAIYEVLEILERMEAVEIEHMNKFEVRQKGVPPLALPTPPKENIDVRSTESTKGSSEGAQQGSSPSNRSGGGSTEAASDPRGAASED